jgi:hypothetical protein
MVDRKVVPFDEFYYQLKLMHLFLLHPVYYSILDHPYQLKQLYATKNTFMYSRASERQNLDIKSIQ